MAVVLDTCAWLWSCAEAEKLSHAARELVTRERRRGGLVVSVFSSLEIAKLVQKRKLRFSIPCRAWIAAAVCAEGVTLHPLTPEICVESTELRGVFHGDPGIRSSSPPRACCPPPSSPATAGSSTTRTSPPSGDDRHIIIIITDDLPPITPNARLGPTVKR